MNDEMKSAAANLNTVLLAIVLGLLSWVGYTTQQTSIAVAVLVEKNITQDRDLLDLRTRVASVELQLAQLKRGF